MKLPRILVVGVALATLTLAACTQEAQQPEQPQEPAGQQNTTQAQQPGGVSGRAVKVAFSAPGADHGWLKAVTDNARAQADELGVELMLTEGTNDSAAQVSQVESLISQKPDVLVILPHEGGPLTPVAQKAMQAGIPVVNVDRAFSSPAAYRTWIGGDNYGIGAAAANFIANELNCQGNVVEIQGVAGISVTEERTKGFTDGIKRCNGGIKIVASQPADFVPDKGLQVMETMLQGNNDIKAVYTHDDDMAMGAVQAIRAAGREDEMFITGAGGSKDAMNLIAEGNLYRATFLYNPSMSASAVSLAKLIAEGKGLSELEEPEVPSYIELPATTVTKENVASVQHLGY
jgi:ribose transport system substrate-binding protein